jgi:hypothetical protein
MNRIAFVLLVTAVALLIDSQAEAQRRVPHYQRTPAISPYTNLFRGDNGGLNSFVGFYEPSQRLRQFVAETNNEFYYQQRATMQESLRLSQEIAAAGEKDPLQQQGLILRPTSSAGSVPRTASGFQTHHRYFPNSAAAGGGTSFDRRGGLRGQPMRGVSIGMGGGGMRGGFGGMGIGGLAR